MSVLKDLQPNRVFYYFEELCKIPHGSYNTRAISDYLVTFAKEHQLAYDQDAADNVVIYKPATAGYEAAPTTILQGHMDMVCEKTADSDHDFFKDPIQIYVDGDFIRAKDTTLGGDNGIAIAYALAILESDTIAHPALEVVITSDEEVGLLGAAALDTSKLKGTYMINIDSEDEGVLTVGCAGGLTGQAKLPLHFWEADGLLLEVTIDQLQGGHSGIDADKNRGNANILMGRYLSELSLACDFMISDIKGGQKDNVITPASYASLVVSEEDVVSVMHFTEEFQAALRTEYAGSDDHVTVTVAPKISGTYPVMDLPSKMRVLMFLRNVPNGVLKMSGLIEGLVQTSANLGVMRIEGSSFVASSGIRSNINPPKYDVGNRMRQLSEYLGGEYQESGVYPCWAYNPDSKLRILMRDVFERMYGRRPVVEAIHAGLECGVFFENINNLDCISIGPDMMDVHTTKERLSISSVGRTWDYLLQVLKEIK